MMKNGDAGIFPVYYSLNVKTTTTTTYMVFGVKAKSLQIRNAVCTTTYMVFGVKAKSLQIRNAVCISGVFSWFS